jgi:F0F1-type ATP synthase membrane subunit c/vacuolar-type H+-ATPase subunit K
MADTYTGTKYPQSIVEEILININEKHKSSAEVTETITTVTQQAYSADGVTMSGAGSDHDLFSTAVTLNKFQYDGKVLYSHLNGTRFEKSIAAGAMNFESNEYNQKVLINIVPAIGNSMDKAIWNGATAAWQTAIAALTPGAGQGAITAAAQTAVAAMPTNQFNSIVATILYNTSNAKAVAGAGLGDYRKVLSPATVTSATIAAEYLKLYNTHFAACPDSDENVHKIFAPLTDKALMVAANKGATTVNPDFVEVNGKWTYNGYTVEFVPMSTAFRIMCNPEYLLFLTDKKDDSQTIEQARGTNLADYNVWKAVSYAETFPVNQRYITVHGG